MTSKIRTAALLLLVAAGCATAGGAGHKPEERWKQADEKTPKAAVFTDDAERSYYQEAQQHEQRAMVAQTSGNMDQARAEYVEAATRYASFMDKFPSSEWVIPLRYRAAELFLQGNQFEQAADQADKIATDPNAVDRSKAVAFHLASQAWVNAANQQVKAGKLEPIKLAYADQRRGEPLKPRTPPGAWKRFVDDVDGYLSKMSADPELQRPPAERRLLPPVQLALIAAEVEFAFDNMEEAQKRFGAIVQRWPGEAEFLVDVVPLYLQTFLIQKDDAGYQAALARVRQTVDAEARKATDPKDKAAFVKVQEAVARAEAGSQFSQAQKLLDEGKPAEAAQAFEALAAGNAGGDVAGALHNAALAWDKAGEGAKAVALRQRIVKEFPDSKVASSNALLIAAYQSKKGEHLASAGAYADFIQRWPDSSNRCVALQNVAAEYDAGKKPLDAAERYLVFGKDPACTKADPNFAAKALYRAGTLFQIGKQRAKAKEAFSAAAVVPNVTDTVAKSQIDDAKKRLKGL